MLEKINAELKSIVEEKLGIDGMGSTFGWATNSQESMCDLTTTVALSIWKQAQNTHIYNEKKWQNPIDLARYLGEQLERNLEVMEVIEAIEIAVPGYINVKFNKLYWQQKINEWESSEEKLIKDELSGKKIMVEYGHPNTHKEMHVGHLRTLVTGEALAKLSGSLGADVVRANYQGDIGPHVAKALYGVKHLLAEKNINMEEIESKSLIDKAKFLGDAYVYGNQEYENNKDEINNINSQLYDRAEGINQLYLQTRSWSLDYFKSIYDRLGTEYDKFYF